MLGAHRRLGALLVAGALSTIALADGAGGRAASGRPPRRLADTGLYSDFAKGEVDARNLPYAPQYPLWSDGSRKRRWVRLPPGASVDAREADHWRFPVGTRFWKEFAWDRRVETRYLERTRRGWIYAAYVWNEEGTDAVLAPEGGASTTAEVAPGRRHAIPSVADCRNCHEGGRSEILGFGALQLSSDRDPLAPHAEPLAPGMVTLETLAASGRVRGLARELLETPPRIAARTPRERAALGYLHANCSGCHDAVGPLASLKLDLRRAPGAPPGGGPPATDALLAAGQYRPPGAAPGTSAWIVPGRPELSTVLTRMESRSPAAQMPPLGTQLADAEAVALLRAWIAEDLKPREGNTR